MIRRLPSSQGTVRQLVAQGKRNHLARRMELDPSPREVVYARLLCSVWGRAFLRIRDLFKGCDNLKKLSLKP